MRFDCFGGRCGVWGGDEAGARRQLESWHRRFSRFLPGSELNVYAPLGFQQSLEEAMAGQMEYSYFPVKLRDLRSRVRSYFTASEHRRELTVRLCLRRHAD